MNPPTGKHPSPDPLSLSSVYLELFRRDFKTDKDESIGTASGFIIQYSNKHYLITNWHVLAGRDAGTNQPLSDTGAVPSRVRLHLIKTSHTSRIEWDFLDIPLNSSSWIEHPEGRSVDVVALPLPPNMDFQLHALDLSLSQTDIKCFPALHISQQFPLEISS